MSKLTEDQLTRMWTIFEKYYDVVTYEQFRRSFLEKTYAILVHDRASGELVGFSGVLFYSRVFEGRRVRLLFGGDTILERSYWGEGKSIAIPFCLLMLKLYLQAPWVPFYFYLISKGYKTYLLMAKNFPTFYPSHRWQTPDDIKRLLRFLSVDRYGPESYDEQAGVLKFPYARKKLFLDVAPITPRELQDPDIAYFARANPTHHEGHELACAAPIDLACLAAVFRKFGARYFRALGGSSRAQAA